MAALTFSVMVLIPLGVWFPRVAGKLLEDSKLVSDGLHIVEDVGLELQDAKAKDELKTNDAILSEYGWAFPSENKDQCSKCHANRSRPFEQFGLCKEAVNETDAFWCLSHTCVQYEAHDNPAAAKCIPVWSQAAYMKQNYNKDCVNAVVKQSRDNNLLANNSEAPELAIMLYETKGSSFFAEAMNLGYHWPYLRMPGYQKTEAWWSYCGLSTLVVALNYLGVDPPFFMGIWRWWSEIKILDLYPGLKNKIDKDPPGTTIHELACISKDMGLTVEKQERGSKENFTKALQSAFSQEGAAKNIVLVNYHRALVGQPGAGHWSPVAAYAKNSDKVLIMDVARYKFPPHWVSVKDLVRAMNTFDVDSNAGRGWILLNQTGEGIKDRLQDCAVPPPKDFANNDKRHAFASAPEKREPSDDGMTDVRIGNTVGDITRIMTGPRELWH